MDACVTGQSVDEGMYGTAEFQVAAQTNSQVIKMPFFSVDGQQVCQCLCGVVMTAVTSIDDGHGESAWKPP